MHVRIDSARATTWYHGVTDTNFYKGWVLLILDAYPHAVCRNIQESNVFIAATEADVCKQIAEEGARFGPRESPHYVLDQS